jgi:Lytic transglycolase
VSPAALQRQAALVGAALLSVLLVVILDQRGDEAAVTAPPASEAQWETATVGVFGRSRFGDTTACGKALTEETLGVAHPVLPCGVDLVVAYKGREVRTEVIELGPVGTNSQFDLSPALADDLGITRPTEIRWRFAG